MSMPNVTTTVPSPASGSIPSNGKGMREITMAQAVREALAEEMRRDPRVFIMGEDVAEAGTPFKVLLGLVDEFGTDRVIDTPISEPGFTAIGVGAAMTGMRPVIDITAGGMEFYGGFLGATVAIIGYLLWRRRSLRLYLDILAPSLMFGMGMARIGCFLNGCCWGAVCPPATPWAVSFPYASHAAIRQWEDRQLTYPAELIVVRSDGEATLLPPEDLKTTPEERNGAAFSLRRAEEQLRAAQSSKADTQTIAQLTKARDAAKAREREQAREFDFLARHEDRFGLVPSELAGLAHNHRSRDVHPAQLYASIGGLLMAFLLNAFFYRRQRQGLVTGLFLLLYPVQRVIEEIIRTDNPHDTAGLTISQFVSLFIFLFGVAFLAWMYRLPLRSPAALAEAVPPPRKGEKSSGKHGRA